MRNFILFSVILTFSCCAINKSRITDLKKIGLIGKVKSVKFNHQAIDEKEGRENKSLKHSDEAEGVYIDSEFFFNKNGMISEQRQYVSNELSQVAVFAYDKSLCLVSKDYYNSSKELVAKSQFKNIFNAKGELIKQTEIRTSEDSSSRLAEVNYRESPYKIMEYLYDEHGNIIQENLIRSTQTPNIRTVTEYKKGRIIKISTIDQNDSLISSNQSKYLEFDSKNNWIKLLILENEQPEVYIKSKIEYYK